MKDKILNNVFFKSTLILLIGGTLTKVVGFILKIIITRKIGTVGIGLYSLMSGTMGLLTTISIFSYPTAMSALISRKQYDSKTLLISSIFISAIINILLIIIMLLFLPI